MNTTFTHTVPSAETIRLLQTGRLRFENPGAGIWVPVAPHPHAKPSFCDDNVALAIRDSGGDISHVWDVTESGPFVEFEAHSVWKSPAGKLVDVSPSLIGATRHFVIPSLSAFSRPFPGNVLLSLSSDPFVQEFARYSSLSNAVIAPHRTVGIMTVRTDIVRLWAQQFIEENGVDCDIEKLVKMCLITLDSKGVPSS